MFVQINTFSFFGSSIVWREFFGYFVRDSMGSNIFFCVLLLAVTSNLSSLADFSLTCSPPAPTCPGTIVNCECEGAEGLLIWTISSTEGGPCEILYSASNSAEPARTITGDCNNITTNASSMTRNNMLSVFNSSLSVTLMEDTATVSCKNITSHSIQHVLHFSSK